MVECLCVRIVEAFLHIDIRCRKVAHRDTEIPMQQESAPLLE